MTLDVIVYLFTIRGVQFVKLTMCWNIVTFSGLTIDEKFGFLRLFGCKLSCIWPQSNKAS